MFLKFPSPIADLAAGTLFVDDPDHAMNHTFETVEKSFGRSCFAPHDMCPNILQGVMGNVVSFRRVSLLAVWPYPGSFCHGLAENPCALRPKRPAAGLFGSK